MYLQSGSVTKGAGMRKAVVRHGDPTTTGGFVMAFASTIHDNGKKVALSGDEATCGNCKGAYKIYGTGDGMSEMQRVVVVHGDKVLCPCGKNRVIIGSNPGIFLTSSDGAGDARSTSGSTTLPADWVSTAAHGSTVFWLHNPDYLKATGGKAYR
jgi:uncharacterized Zn-binding protein involved in type VI secretion